MERSTYRGRIIEVVEREVEVDGQKKTFELARRSPGVRVIIPRDSRVLIACEYRVEQNGYDHRLPGGKVFDSLAEYTTALAGGEDIVEAARRAAIKEAKEEVGIEVLDLSLFHTSRCGATIEWDLYYFVAHQLRDATQALEHGEDITAAFVERERAREMCLDGSIREERSALVLLRYLASE
jgi:ADP-ribose pyrophosphatase YjhB (NUDIX family)